MDGEQPGVLGQAKSLWFRLSPGRRMVAASVVVATVAVVAYLMLSGPRDDYVTLFADLPAADAGDVVSALQARGVPYRVSDGGTTIKVPSDRVHEARVNIASSGLLDGGAGFEIFDEQSFGTSSFVEKVNFTRAIQGELARSIAALEVVDGARVHVAMGKRSVFKDADEPPSASVALRMRKGRKIGQEQVRGIVHLVSSSVDGLAAENVVVIDDRGNVLSAGDDEQQGAEVQNDLERELSERVRGMLERVVGPGHVAVAITAQMDHRRVDQTEEIYDKDNTAVRSESRTIEGAFNPGDVGGVAGARGNLPGAPAPTATAGGPGSRLQETRNFEVNRIVRHTVDPSLRVKTLHVAVLVDYARNEDDEPIARTAEQLGHLEAVAREAAGIDKDRGDRIEIRSVPFVDQPDPFEGEDAIEPEVVASGGGLPIVILAAGGAGLLVLVVIVFLVLRSRRKRGEPTQLVSLPARLTDVEAALDSKTPLALGDGAQDASSGAIHERVIETVRRDTDRASRVISSWLSEPSGTKAG